LQDPGAALDPRIPAWKAVAEPLAGSQRIGSRYRQSALDLMERVTLRPNLADKLPSQLSGGEKQRLTIARALAAGPSVIVCDEIVTALDASARGGVLNLLRDLQVELGLRFLFISHDIAVVSQFTDRLMVMLDGELIETVRSIDVALRPSQVYTKKLIASAPQVRSRSRAADGQDVLSRRSANGASS